VRTGLSDGLHAEILDGDAAGLEPGTSVLTGLVSSSSPASGGAPFGMQRRGGRR